MTPQRPSFALRAHCHSWPRPSGFDWLRVPSVIPSTASHLHTGRRDLPPASRLLIGCSFPADVAGGGLCVVPCALIGCAAADVARRAGKRGGGEIPGGEARPTVGNWEPLGLWGGGNWWELGATEGCWERVGGNWDVLGGTGAYWRQLGHTGSVGGELGATVVNWGH